MQKVRNTQNELIKSAKLFNYVAAAFDIDASKGKSSTAESGGYCCTDTD